MPPQFTQSPSNKTILENEDVEFTCSASGRPDPGITWRKLPGQSVVAKGTKYTKTNVQRTEQGEYQCDVGNGVKHNITANVFLTVNCKYPELMHCLFSLWSSLHRRLLSVWFYSFTLSLSVWGSTVRSAHVQQM